MNMYYDMFTGKMLALGTEEQIKALTGGQIEQSIEYAQAVGTMKPEAIYIDNRVKKSLTEAKKNEMMVA